MNKYLYFKRLFTALFFILIPLSVFSQAIDRAGIRDQWISCMDRVARQSGIGRAQQVVSFTKLNNVLAEPHPQGNMFLEKGKTERWFAIIPLIEGDARLSPVWANLANSKNAGAYFLPENRALIVKDHLPTSPTWKGIIGLHEGYHAMAFMNLLYDWKNKQIFCEQERDTHIFVNQVTEKIGGQRYVDFVERLSREIEAELKQKNHDPTKVIVNRSRSFKVLDEIFGPALSDFERNFRDTQVWVHAYFIFYDRIFGQESEMRKGLYLLSVYYRSGVLKRD